MSIPSPHVFVVFLGLLVGAPSLDAQSAPPARAAAPADTYREKVDLVSDASVEESLARQNNIDFDSVRIDGEKSGVSLSALSADQVLAAVATKVPTPDLDADAVGGLLQLTTRRAYEQKRRTLRGSVGLFHDPMAEAIDPEMVVTVGSTFGSRQRAGYLASLEHKSEHDADEDIGLEWDGRAGELDRFTISDTRDVVREVNFSGTVDHKWGDKAFGFVRSDFGTNTSRSRSRSLQFDLPANPGQRPASATPIAGVRLRRSVDDESERETEWTIATGGGYRGEEWTIDSRLTHTSENGRVLHEYDFDFLQSGLAALYRHDEPAYPQVIGPAGENLGSASQQVLDELEVHRGTDRETDSVASVDLARLWQETPTPFSLKFGAKARLQRTRRDHLSEIYEPAGPGFSVADAGAPADSRSILEGRYNLAGFPDVGAARRVFETQPFRFQRNEDKTRSDTDPSNYDVRQSIYAGYAMANLTAMGLRWVVGARVEQTAARFLGNEVTFDETGAYENTSAVTARRSYTHIFPGVHASRQLGKRWTVFASWTQSIRRPEYVDLVPSRSVSRSDREIDEGNPELKPTLYTNYDAAVDVNYGKEGSVSLELFHRSIRDPRTRRRTILTNGAFAGYERSRPENGGNAELQGAQLSWSQGLAFVSPRLEGLELEVNATYQRSRQTVETRPAEKLPLGDRPELELSVQLSYNHGPYYLSAEMERTSGSLDSLGSASSEDRYFNPRTSWDLSLSRQLGKGLRVFAEVANVTQQPDRSYEGDRLHPSLYSRRVRDYRVGLKWEL
jgi:TonB-dependent receptor